MKNLFLLLLLIVAPANAQPLRHTVSPTYVWPEEREVLAKLQRWQEQKFGILLHWGVYSVPGICESWPLTSEDWITPDTTHTYDEFKRWYWSLDKEFNPTRFNPAQWARVAREAGMRYAIFTTKHHDGFCLWDSRQTDYNVAHSAFGNNERRDVARHVFDAFRSEGLMTGAYFSKPDWHSPYYWWPARATHDRYHNYPIAQYPERWNNYRSFVYRQVDELMSGYGPLDILWLDGGWCTLPREDIGLDSIVRNAREKQPGLLVVDRTCGGPYENYQTPEQRIPDHQLLTPWESCITLTNDWGWVPRPVYKSATDVVSRLCEVVAKGGSLLLGVGPTPDGEIEPEAVSRLQEVGEWLHQYGEAIYGSVPTPVYRNAEGNVWFTAHKNGVNRYALVVGSDSAGIPHTVTWQGNYPNRLSYIEDLGTGEWCKWHRNERGEVVVTLPRKHKAAVQAVALRFSFVDTPLYKDSTMATALRVEDLLGRMTAEEKLAQLQCPIGWTVYEKAPGGKPSLTEAFKDRMRQAPVGSLWTTFRADPWSRKILQTGLDADECLRVANLLQRFAVEDTRLGIPLLLCEESAHGVMAPYATVFPTGLGQAATWNPQLLHSMGQTIGRQLTRRGAHFGFGPVLDLARDPRWSRVEETLGEDPLLAGTLGSEVVRGMREAGAHGTLKHLIAYGSPQGGVNGAEATESWSTILQEHAVPFRMAVEAGAEQVMTSYNSVEGVPCTANRHLITDLLRGEWGFRGTVISDLHSIEGIHTNHGYASTPSEAALMALQAGVDIDLEGNAYRNESVNENVNENENENALLDSAVARVLTQKFELGLFEHPYSTAKKEKVLQPDTLALQVARESIVLLKNDTTNALARPEGTLSQSEATERTSNALTSNALSHQSALLPLPSDLRRIAVIGPNADAPYNQLGDYTAPQPEGHVVTILEGLRRAYPQAEVLYERACGIRDTLHNQLCEAKELAASADVAIVVVGGSSARDFRTSYTDNGAAEPDSALFSSSLPDIDCGEGFDRQSLRLLGLQEQLIDSIADTGTPMVVVYVEGRPLDMNLAVRRADALLVAWYPGEAGGTAVADVLTGRYNPSGRLPVSIPRSVGGLPVYYSRPSVHDYVDGSSTPLYEFGYGLSYSTFEYSDQQTETVGDSVRVSVTVRNTSRRPGSEVVQVYSRQPQNGRRHLLAFQKIPLGAGQSRRLTFTLSSTEAETMVPIAPKRNE